MYLFQYFEYEYYYNVRQCFLTERACKDWQIAMIKIINMVLNHASYNCKESEIMWIQTLFYLLINDMDTGGKSANILWWDIGLCYFEQHLCKGYLCEVSSQL